MADARVTRQSIETLIQETPAAAMNQHYLMALTKSTTGVYYETVSSVMALTQTARVIERHETVSSTLAFIDYLQRVREADAENTMTLLSVALDYLIPQDFIYIEQNLGLIQTVFGESGLFKVTGSILSLVQSVDHVAPYHLTITAYLNLTHEARSLERHERLSQAMALRSVAGLIRELSVSNTLTFVQVAERVFHILQDLNLSQGLEYGRDAGGIVSPMELGQHVQLNAIWLRQIFQDLGIGHSMTYLLDSPCANKVYGPFIGESTVPNQPTPPDEIEPYVGGLPEGARFILAYPPLQDTSDIVELRAPNLDNRDRLSNTRVNRETRGGELSIYADPTWPQLHTLVLTISGLEKADIDDLQTFMTAHLGHEISLIDWEGREWVGVITTPSEQAVQDNNTGFTVSLEFEGILVGANTPGSAIEFDSLVAVQGTYNRSLESDLGLVGSASFLLN